MSPKPTGRARRALKQALDARRENAAVLLDPGQASGSRSTPLLVALEARLPPGAEVDCVDLYRDKFPVPHGLGFPLEARLPSATPLTSGASEVAGTARDQMQAGLDALRSPGARPSSPPRRPELDAWASPVERSGPVTPSSPPETLHPVHGLRTEQWMLLELITQGMNAAGDAQEAYDLAVANVDRMKTVVRRVLAFETTRRSPDGDN